MAYFTIDELEDRMGEGDFSATTFPDDTMVGVMITEISNMWDGYAQQVVGTETPSETVTQACISAAIYQVHQIRAGAVVDPNEQINIFKTFVGPTGETATLTYNQEYPSSSGKW